MFVPWLIALQINQAVVEFWASQAQAITGKPLPTLDTSFDWQGLMASIEGKPDVSDASDQWDGRLHVSRRQR